MYYKWVVVVIVVVVVVVVVVVDGGGDVDLEVSKVMVLPPNHPKCLVIFLTRWVPCNREGNGQVGEQNYHN